jgi:hypothetical protein
MKSQTTPFNGPTPQDSQRVLLALNMQERQYVMAMARRLGITFMQAARELARQKQEARKR